MGIMLPDELIWILDKIGLEWPDVDEDEIHKGADLTRAFRNDLEALVHHADTKVTVDVAAGVRSKAGDAYVNAWNTTRSSHLQTLIDALDPVATGIDVGGYVVSGLKVKFAAQLTWEVATILPLLATPLTAALAVAKMVATKVAMGIIVDLAVSEAVDQVTPLVIDVLKDQVPGIVQAVLDAPIVEDIGGEISEIYWDLEVLEQASNDNAQHAADMESLVTQYMNDIAALKITGE